MPKKKKTSGEDNLGSGVRSLFTGLVELIEKVGYLAEKGEELKRSGTFSGQGQGKGLKGVYGFSVKMGLGDQDIKVEPFGNVHPAEEAEEAEVQEIREPVVDIFEEADHLLVVAEMPGISSEDVSLKVTDDLLTIEAVTDDKKYRKELLLPGSYPREKMEVSCNNGILRIKCVQ
ncbi:Hsp20/alpha crystallin family protein [Solidesulfovibrio sp. C21]|uniref:Hsp20/alpha crystallin family protein n=1 Tax=Solidesulfovibrio sp. C21 TaxID=3398613 RepID=UPI0039FCD8A1